MLFFFSNSCLPVLFQSGCRSSADGFYVAESPHRPEEPVVMAVPDETFLTDTLLEHHHGRSESFHVIVVDLLANIAFIITQFLTHLTLLFNRKSSESNSL